MDVDTLWFMNPGSAALRCWGATALGLALAGITYALVVYPQFRREQFRGRAGSRSTGLIVGVLVALPLLWMGWSPTRARFATIDVGADLYVGWVLPDQERVLGRDEVESIRQTRVTVGKGRSRDAIRITLADGDVLQSGAIGRDDAEERMAVLQGWLDGAP